MMPMGLTNAQATFMRMMNNLFKDMLDQGVVAFLNDMLIYRLFFFFFLGCFDPLRLFLLINWASWGLLAGLWDLNRANVP